MIKYVFDEVTEFDGKKFYYFRASNNSFIIVTRFKDGIVAVKAMAGENIWEFSEMVQDCFKKGSNFVNELLSSYDLEDKIPFKGIEFNFNDITVLVTKENSNKSKIYDAWKIAMEENAEKSRIEWEAYTKTAEYRIKRAKELKLEWREKQVREKLLSNFESMEIEFKDANTKKVWDKWIEIDSKDFYSAKFALYWVKYMQYLMNKHNKSVSQIADNSAHLADRMFGITGFQYGLALNAISNCWKYGDELRKWHNKQFGCEDSEGVVNPAVINIC